MNVEWTGKYKDQTATLADGRKLRVWWSDPQWKASIDGKSIFKRGESAPSREAARTAVLSAAGIVQHNEAARIEERSSWDR